MSIAMLNSLYNIGLFSTLNFFDFYARHCRQMFYQTADAHHDVSLCPDSNLDQHLSIKLLGNYVIQEATVETAVA